MPSFATTAGGIYEVGGGIDAVISIHIPRPLAGMVQSPQLCGRPAT
jgi:hypothetical protein